MGDLIDKRGAKFADGPDHGQRMEAARARAGYELGDSSWAGLIVGAYLYPEADAAALEDELARPVTIGRQG